LDEQELARHCSQGERLAEDELYRRYAARVYTLCRRYVGDDDEAKDLMQESLIRALDKISTFEYLGKGSLYGWISRIAINKALNQIRRKRWRTVSLDLWTQDTLPEPTEQEMEAIPEEKLLEWISKLPDVRRTVFNLYCIDGYSHREISEMLGISEKGSASSLAKARRQLKEDIKRYLNGQES
jgi:RNA polymerase sigma-70 factor (ECF subfamily)